ncbi:hypothetical protein HDU86_005197 [Geranomyces michiganensis]|nr:hypothetical protein HDU86_005197 [Geranomyces michiganensis]
MTTLHPTTINRVEVDGLNVFYREAGAKNAPVLLALHGYPTSSLSYRHLLTGLSDKYRVIAPDLPGFGFTEVPAERRYEYTFANIANTVCAFVHKLGLVKYALYVFDYGAPTGFRLFLSRPESVTAIITQNGNAFVEGLGKFWVDIQRYWDDPSPANREAIRYNTEFEATKFQYVHGEAHPERIPPETWHLDAALLSRPGNAEIQLDLFFDYKNNVDLYPAFQKQLEKYQPPVLAVWGREDPIFIPPGAEKFKSVVKEAEVILLEGAGHFALESHPEEIVGEIRKFLAKKGI